MTADVTLAANGDRDAFVRLVDAYASTVTGIALAIVRDLQASQDIAQEVFLVAWRDLKKLRNPSSFLPWVRQMTRNLANSSLRSRYSAAASAVPRDLPDARPAPDVEYERAEQQRIIDQVIGALPDDAREVITLYYKEGRSVAQVADLLGLSEVVVKKRMSRARAKIREELLEKFGESVRATAPGAAFTASVAAALSIAAPASAATTGAAAAKVIGGTKLLALVGSALPGAVAGGAGFAFGVKKHLERAIDDEERRELRRFRTQGLALVTIASFGFALAGFFESRALLVLDYLGFVAVMMWLQFVRLPRITARRVARERAVDPVAAAAREKRDRIKAIAGCTAGLTISALTVLYCYFYVF